VAGRQKAASGRQQAEGGEYYTRRPLIRAIVQAVKPQMGERIYDGACGSESLFHQAFTGAS
jgi:type I restriction enzyme M protein